MRRIKTIVGILAVVFVTATPALARRAVSTPAASAQIFMTSLSSDVADYGQAHVVRKQMAARPVDTPRRRYAPYREYRQKYHPVVTTAQTELPRTNVTMANARPQECRGIAWCGCFLRNYLGVGDTSLNLAINWAGVGRAAGARSGTIVVWRHHVGLMRSDPDSSGRAIVLSGNDSGATRERLRSIRGAVAFREL